MTDDTIELTRRKILASVGAVGAAGAGVGMGTSALFSDEEEFAQNTLAAGELDLKIDWQQRYFGPANDSFPAYGAAGRPWVNAHPDEDGDGIQSLDSDAYRSVPNDGVVTYEDQGANIQEYLTCETLDHDYDFGPNENSLIELEDVKPGDSGEVTFSFHLCDNPGYVWFCGELNDASENGTNDPESASPDEEDGVVELLDAVTVKTWYDVDCNNEFDEDEEPLAGSPTTLRGLFENFAGQSGGCFLLDASVYPGIDPDETSQDCLSLGEIEFTSGGLETASNDDQVVRVQEDPLEIWTQFTDPNNGEFDDIIVRFFEFADTSGNDPVNSDGDLTDIVEFDWEVVPSDTTVTGNQPGVDGDDFSSDDIGMCQSVITARDGTENTASLIGNGCSFGENDIVSPDGGSPIQSFELFYCAPETADPVCFPDGRTFCVGFEWEIPSSVGNEIQSDAVSFDLGFYTEQCRNNSNPTGPGTDSRPV